MLKNINLEVPEHSVTCLIGPSGCGKSTLLRCTNLLEEIRLGRFCCAGENLTARAPRRRRHSAPGGHGVPAYNLFPHMTVMQNITLAPRKVLRASRK